jgi:hypothetical protein
MASIRQRSRVWQARVRRKGYPEEVGSFKTKAEAQIWARGIESAMDQGSHQSIHAATELLLADVLHRYMHEVTPSKRGAQREAESIQFMLRQKMAAYSMAHLTPAVIASYCDERLKTVGAGTIIRELSIMSSIITHARKEWGMATATPCALHRERRSPALTLECIRTQLARSILLAQATLARAPLPAPAATATGASTGAKPAMA